MILRSVKPLMRPLARLLLRTVDMGDPWRRTAHPVPLHLYGAGARRDFSWYFEGESRVPVRCLDDVLAWLRGCTYGCDPDLFNEIDFWQHPLTFEQLRRGDCEDFALWAWRKLVRLGYEAEFVAGHWRQPGLPAPAGHAWVLFRKERELFLLDPVVQDPAHVIRPVPAVRDEYIPEVSVDHRFVQYVYGGYYLLRTDAGVAA